MSEYKNIEEFLKQADKYKHKEIDFLRENVRLTAELEAVKKENEGYRKYVTGGPDGLAHMIEAYEELKKIWNSGHDKLKDNLDLAVKGLEFYGDKFNWRTNSGKVGITPLTNGQDGEVIDGHWTQGKLARETLAKIKRGEK